MIAFPLVPLSRRIESRRGSARLTVGVWLVVVPLAVSVLLAQPGGNGPEKEPTKSSPSADTSPTSTSGRPVKRDDGPRFTVAEARLQASVLQDVYISTLLAMHRRYFKDDARQPIPSRVMEDVFRDVGYRTKVKARWLAVNAQAMSLEHEPQDEFERQAARQIATGKDDIELVEEGVYRRATSISLASSCLKCHAPAPMRPEVARYAALVISVPVKSDPVKSD